jgi:uncharacterized membrane protein (UPF0136 family)
VLALWVRRHLGAYLSREWWRNAIQVVLATAPALIAAGVMAYWLSQSPPLVVLLASGSLGSLIYLILWKLLEKWMP